MDKQIIEILGRNRLIVELAGAGIEVAVPIRDRGIDLIAYRDDGQKDRPFPAVPIQMKAAMQMSFSVDRKYEKFSNLILVFVWHLNGDEKPKTFALTFDEARKIAKEMGWTKTASWEEGKYTTNSPSAKLCGLLEKHEMSQNTWKGIFDKVR